MKHLIVMAISLLAAPPTFADVFYKLVGYVCDTKSDSLIITYDGAYNEIGKSMVENKQKTQWDPWSLVTIDDDSHVRVRESINQRCMLSDGTYNIKIAPIPGNIDTQGRCGAWITASVEITRNTRPVYTIERFEQDCMDNESQIIYRATVRSSKKTVTVIRKEWSDFYKQNIR